MEGEANISGQRPFIKTRNSWKTSITFGILGCKGIGDEKKAWMLVWVRNGVLEELNDIIAG